jgi:SAM-dependent methyltransferase
MNKTINAYYDRFQKDITELWPTDVTAALGEKVNSQTILKYLYRDKVRLTRIIRYLAPLCKHKKILDVGCAYGFYDIILQGSYGCSVTGLEMEESIAAYCRLLDKYKIPVIQHTLTKEKWPLRDNTFDIVIFSEILEHLRVSPLRALREIHRVLKPGGLILLTTPNMGYLRNIIHLLTGKNILQPFPEDDKNWDNVTDAITHTRVYVMDEVKALLQKAGFEIIDSQYLSAEALSLQLRPTVLLHVIYIFLITIIPSFQDGMLFLGKKNTQ